MEKQFFPGTLMEVKSIPNKEKYMESELHLVQYDDGDVQWTNLYHCKFQQVELSQEEREEELMWAQKALLVNRLAVGAKVSIWWEKMKKSYAGTLAEIRDVPKSEEYSTAKRHRIQYDDGSKRWTNLVLCVSLLEGTNLPRLSLMVWLC